MEKHAVILLNLGSPDSTAVADVRNYLEEFLLDERVINKSPLVRNLVVRCFILPTRPQKSAEAYAKVWTDEGSPLVVTTQKQQALLQEAVDCHVEIGMRYGNPSTDNAVKNIKHAGITRLLIFPLYPHYAMSSYETAVVRIMEAIAAQAPEIKTTLVQPYFQDPNYIDALVQSAQPYLEDDFDKLLFSFHGIPESHLRQSDPSHAHCLTTPDCCATCHPAHATCYRHQCITTAHLFKAKAGIPDDKFMISFQSRLGREPWLTPYTDKVLEDLPGQGVKRLKVICPAFISDCLETLEEIAQEGKAIFTEAGGESFTQIPCLNDHPAWINYMQQQVQQWHNKSVVSVDV